MTSPATLSPVLVVSPAAPPKRGPGHWRLPKPETDGGAELPAPVCRWTFQEPAGQPRVSEGRERYALREVNGPIARVDDGPAGGSAVELKEGQWFNLPRAECPALDFHGAGKAFSIVAWIKRAPKSVPQCQAVAGMWNETVETRQYCLFLDLHIWDSLGQACGHLSATGAPSPGYKYCMEAAIGATPLPQGEWRHVAFTFDGTWAQIYVDGRLDYRPGLNPYFWPLPINDGGAEGSDFTVGAVFRSGEMGNWFTGRLGELAVYDLALDAAAVVRLRAETAAEQVS